jgi:hypothetical protein
MSGETLPGWFLFIYYLFLILTLFTTSFLLIWKKYVPISIINLILVITVPIVALLNSIGRTEGTELDYLISSISQGSLWTIFVLLGFLYMLFSWIQFFWRTKKTSLLS